MLGRGPIPCISNYVTFGLGKLQMHNVNRNTVWASTAGGRCGKIKSSYLIVVRVVDLLCLSPGQLL